MTAELIALEGGRVLITGTNSKKLDAPKAALPVILPLRNDAGDPGAAAQRGEFKSSEVSGLDAAFLNAGHGTVATVATLLLSGGVSYGTGREYVVAGGISELNRTHDAVRGVKAYLSLDALRRTSCFDSRVGRRPAPHRRR